MVAFIVSMIDVISVGIDFAVWSVIARHCILGRMCPDEESMQRTFILLLCASAIQVVSVSRVIVVFVTYSRRIAKYGKIATSLIQLWIYLIAVT